MGNLLKKVRTPFRYTFSNATLILILVNVAVFFASSSLRLNDSALALSVQGFLGYKMFWQPVTYMFVHAGLSHLLGNMLGLLFFGLQVEKAVGSKEFLLMYFLVGILSGLFSLGLYYCLGIVQISGGMPPYAFAMQLVGASGAVYGILFAYAVIFPKARVFVWFVLPVPAPLLVVIYTVIEFFSQFSGSNVAHYAHLAGFAFAFLYFLLRMGVNPVKVWKDAYR